MGLYSHAEGHNIGVRPSKQVLGVRKDITVVSVRQNRFTVMREVITSVSVHQNKF